jgi:hypothetical protein
VIGNPGQADLRAALADLREWRRAGSHRRDLNGDGSYEYDSAITLMDAWWPLLVRSEFQPALGKGAFAQLQDMLPDGDHTRRDPNAPDFFGGWWGYSSKDLRSVLGARVPGWSHAYCGHGSRKACRRALLRSLRAALKVTPQELYGHGECESTPLRSASTATAQRSPPGSTSARPLPEPPDLPADGLALPRRSVGPPAGRPTGPVYAARRQGSQ